MLKYPGTEELPMFVGGGNTLTVVLTSSYYGSPIYTNQIVVFPDSLCHVSSGTQNIMNYLSYDSSDGTWTTDMDNNMDSVIINDFEIIF